MKTITVNPAPGRTVRDPDTGLEIKGPTQVPADNAFWIRRLADGDVMTAVQQPAVKEGK